MLILNIKMCLSKGAKMKINYITIMVRNLEKSLEFYKELAYLEIVRQIELPAGKICFLSDRNSDSTMLELIEFKDSNKVETEGVTISFLAAVDLVIIRDKAIELGYQPSNIIKQGPKPEHFSVKDPDGITIEFSK